MSQRPSQLPTWGMMTTTCSSRQPTREGLRPLPPFGGSMRVFIDFETRSPIDLRKCGVYRYAEDENTDILCCAYKIEDQPVQIWVPEWAQDRFKYPCDEENFLYAMANATEVHAHNAQFERVMWNEVMTRYGFDPIPRGRWWCTAAKAAYMGLPRYLEGACLHAGVTEKKDKGEGYSIMMKMCKPRTPLLKERKVDPDWQTNLYWHENDYEFLRLVDYCMQDVRAEYDLDQALPDLPPIERKIYLMDQQINDRGLRVDMDAIAHMKDAIEDFKETRQAQLSRVTEGQVQTATQNKKLMDWLNDQNFFMDNLQAGTVESALKGDLPSPVRQVLEIRQELSKASIKKLDSMQNAACRDGRVRGTVMYYGAQRTGRWAGRIIQPQNLPRGTKSIDEVEVLIREFKDDVALHNPIQDASDCIRGLITAAEGKALLDADFANIEGRCAAWLAGENWKIRAFEEYDAGTGPDLYKLAYSKSFGIPVDQVDKDQRFIGKVQELALQYQGWVGAFATMAENYGVHLPEDTVADICGKWRRAHPCIVNFWKQLEKAAVTAVTTGKQVKVGRLRLGTRGEYLHIRLPSGRLLSYNKPHVVSDRRPNGEVKPQLRYWGADGDRGFQRQHTYGGKLFENVIQAIARDIMAEAMLRVEEAGFPLVLTVHDEIGAELETEEAMRREQEFGDLMNSLPPWATGLPVAVAGWVGERYRKD